MNRTTIINIFLNVTRYTVLLVGAFLIVNGILATFMSGMNVGIVLTYVAGFVLSAFGLLFPLIPRTLCTVLSVAFFAVFIALCTVFVLLYAIEGPVTDYTEDAVIVLGSSLLGEEVGYTLRARLDAALAYCEKNADCLIVVSGGQGSDEAISESLAMERYLIAHGIDPTRIIKEDASTSTLENLENSKRILDARFDGDYRAAFITSDYHSYRASCVFADVFGTDANYYCAQTPFFTVIPSGIREILAIIKYKLF